MNEYDVISSFQYFKDHQEIEDWMNDKLTEEYVVHTFQYIGKRDIGNKSFLSFYTLYSKRMLS